MSNWNYADVFEAVADVLPDAPALTHGNRTQTWGETDRRADGLARTFLDLGVHPQDKMALYLHNCSEYLEASFAAFKVGLVPVNTNYRYADNELVYLWSNADAVVVVFHGLFAERIEGLRARVPKVRSWLWVDDGSGPCPAWATPYEDAAVAGDGNRTWPPWGRSGDDICMLYTGGTTGMPKGVMWRQDDLFARMNENSLHRYAEANGLAGIRADLEAYGPGATMMPACPLMHGTGWFTALECLSEGGRVVTLTSRGLDPDDLLDTVERQKVNWLVIVGDAFSRPILGALDEHRGRWDISSLVGIISSGVMWSKEAKKGLLGHHPTMVLMDAFSSSEALGMGSSVSSGSSAVHTAEIHPRLRCAGARPGRPRSNAGLRSDRSPRHWRPQPPRLLQGRRQDQ